MLACMFVVHVCGTGISVWNKLSTLLVVHVHEDVVFSTLGRLEFKILESASRCVSVVLL